MTITYGHFPDFPGWTGAPSFLSSIIERESCTSVLEIGSGANPTLSPAEIDGRGLRYTTNDRLASELAKADPAYKTLLLDMATASPDKLPLEAFDLVFSRMVNEHVADGERYYRNIFNVLRPGGVTAHCFSTLYALPFVVNRLLPEQLTSRVLNVIHPRNRYQLDKFPAHYSWSRGPTKRMIERLSRLGYEVVEYRGYFGHDYYNHPALRLVCAMEEAKAKWLCRHPIPVLTSYAVVILRRPR
ncbi:MAG: class I SAM-dependent methyltransferase [Actinobacteria bacterium]|nr:class I SAM-dependent methyltransferase [Actinomycetota bacterium]